MKYCLKIKIISLLLVCLLLSPLYVITCSAQQYQISEEQLTQLENNLNQLEQNSIEQNKQLQKVSELLVRSDKQTQLLSEKLTQAENSINLTQNLLNQANQSFETYAKESKSEIRKLRLQRDLSFVALAYLFIKK